MCGAAQSFVEIPPRGPVHQYRSTSSASGLSEESFTKPPIPSQCRLSSHCCCCCWYSPLLQALFVAPGASLALPVVRLVHLSCISCHKPSFSSGGESLAGIAEPLLLLLPPSWLLLRTPDSKTLDAGGARGCSSFALMATTRFLGKLSKNASWFAAVANALQRWSPRLPPCWNDTVLNDRPLVYDQLLALAHPGQLSAHPNCWKSALRGGARRTCRNSGTKGGKGTAACGCNTGALIPTVSLFGAFTHSHM